jgi:hypothetical protein
MVNAACGGQRSPPERPLSRPAHHRLLVRPMWRLLAVLLVASPAGALANAGELSAALAFVGVLVWRLALLMLTAPGGRLQRLPTSPQSDPSWISLMQPADGRRRGAI